MNFVTPASPIREREEQAGCVAVFECTYSIGLHSQKQKMSGSIKVLSLQCNKINESNTFTSGDIVEGKVVLEVTKEINMDSFFVKLMGDADVRWTEKTGFDETTYRDHDRYFKLKQYFIQESSKKGELTQYKIIMHK